jgi:hypothetical protein
VANSLPQHTFEANREVILLSIDRERVRVNQLQNDLGQALSTRNMETASALRHLLDESTRNLFLMLDAIRAGLV